MRKIWFILAMSLALVLTACGGSSSATTDLNVTLTDFVYSPTQFKVPAGKEISLEVNNTGAVIHNFIIMNLGTTAGTEYTAEDDANVYFKIELPAGGSMDTSFTAPSEPGEYEVVCSTPGHLQAGMIAKMIVVPSEE